MLDVDSTESQLHLFSFMMTIVIRKMSRLAATRICGAVH